MNAEIYKIAKNLGLDKKDVDKVLSASNASGMSNNAAVDVYKAGTRYGTVSSADLYKAGTEYGTVSPKDVYKAVTYYGTVSARDLYKAGTYYGTISINDF